MLGSMYTTSAHYGIPAILLYAVGAFIFNALYFVYAFIRMKWRRETFNIKETGFFDQETGKFNKGILLVMLADAITQGAG